eukprot:1192235-Prorocentrum_minimum.AAC.1
MEPRITAVFRPEILAPYKNRLFSELCFKALGFRALGFRGAIAAAEPTQLHFLHRDSSANCRELRSFR